MIKQMIIKNGVLLLSEEVKLSSGETIRTSLLDGKETADSGYLFYMDNLPIPLDCEWYGGRKFFRTKVSANNYANWIFTSAYDDIRWAFFPRNPQLKGASCMLVEDGDDFYVILSGNSQCNNPYLQFLGQDFSENVMDELVNHLWNEITPSMISKMMEPRIPVLDISAKDNVHVVNDTISKLMMVSNTK